MNNMDLQNVFNLIKNRQFQEIRPYFMLKNQQNIFQKIGTNSRGKSPQNMDDPYGEATNFDMDLQQERARILASGATGGPVDLIPSRVRRAYVPINDL